jgi:hypothetical protein
MPYTSNEQLIPIGQATTPKVPQIQMELDELGFVIDALEKAIESLSVRYSPITTPADPPLEEVDPRKDPRSLVMVAENIRLKSSKVKSLIVKVQSLEQRAEI